MADDRFRALAPGEGAVIECLRARAAGGRKPQLGIVGGTFDPIHLGHVEMGLAARDELGLDALLFMPAGVPSFKRDAHLASTKDRLAMVRIATACLAGAVGVSERETARPGITYTSDTLVELAQLCPEGTCLTFVLGADSLETLPLWHDAPAIARLARIAVARRAGHDVTCALAALDASGLDFDVAVLERVLPDVSSTLVRSRVREGGDVADLVGSQVAAYIADHGLYRSSQR
ncbi:MAG: nicotinate-nucleotide adenylyltransferase [Coriobacteriia bacterium]|nr:nicotinate-nucleotide adenylyltransferase [Coriobacteriia bacterium]MBS5478054.1 nicotinate-nucleotide adenylyltransferase [Coriobacteriia bacterium]